jgi:hypothetical protein
MLEPPATVPEHGHCDLWQSYSNIYCGSSIWAERLGGETFPWPQESQPVLCPVDPFTGSEFKATMVAAQKRSAMKSSLYGLRRGVVEELGRRKVPLALAGAGWAESGAQRWNRGSRALVRAARTAPLAVSLREAYGRVDSRGVTYVGPVEDKFAFMQKAPMAIVVENSLDYVSEKLFDAVRAGVAPIYVGPCLEDFGVPSPIALATAPRITDIVRRVCTTDAAEIAECIHQGRQWLSAKEYQSHNSHVVFRALGERIGAVFATGEFLRRRPSDRGSCG